MNRDTVDTILSWLDRRENSAVSMKNDQGLYTYADKGWSQLAEVPSHKITGKSDKELPWGTRSGRFIQSLDSTTRKNGYLKRVDRLTHFQKKIWTCTTTERLYIPGKDTIVCIVTLSDTDEFCRMANQVTERGITFNGFSLSIKQLYLLHQLLFHVPQKQTAQELNCPVRQVNQQFRALREYFMVQDSQELIRILAANGLLALLQHFELLFRQQWIPSELKYS